MTKTLTENRWFYTKNGIKDASWNIVFKSEVLAPVPSYRQLYGPNDGNMPTGVFTVLKIIKRDIENAQKRRSLTDLECGIKSQVVSLLKRYGVK